MIKSTGVNVKNILIAPYLLPFPRQRKRRERKGTARDCFGFGYFLAHPFDSPSTSLGVAHGYPGSVRTLVRKLFLFELGLIYVVDCFDMISPTRFKHFPLSNKNGPEGPFLFEREKGFEPSTTTLATWSSTTELLPQIVTDMLYAKTHVKNT